MNDSNVIRDGGDELEILCYKVLLSGEILKYSEKDIKIQHIEIV